MKKWAVILLLSMLWILLVPVVQAEELVPFTDSTGRTVQVPNHIERISPSGALAQIFLFALAPDYFVGLSVEWDENAWKYVGDYVELPVLGNLYTSSSNLNLEELAARDPQIIIDVGEAKGSIVEDLDSLQEQLGIPAIHVNAYLGDYAQAYRTMGALLGLEERSEALATYCEKVYERTQILVEKIGDAGKKDLLYCLGAEGLNVIAKGSFHGEVLDLLSNNLAVISDFSSKGTGDPVDMEQLLLWDPEYIIFAPDSVYNQVENDPLWQELQAVQNGKCVKAPFGPYNWLGMPSSVQRYLGMIWLADLLYPDAVDYDLQEEVTEYYKLFYHCDLTQELYDDLMRDARVK